MHLSFPPFSSSPQLLSPLSLLLQFLGGIQFGHISLLASYFHMKFNIPTLLLQIYTLINFHLHQTFHCIDTHESFSASFLMLGFGMTKSYEVSTTIVLYGDSTVILLCFIQGFVNKELQQVLARLSQQRTSTIEIFQLLIFEG